MALKAAMTMQHNSNVDLTLICFWGVAHYTDTYVNSRCVRVQELARQLSGRVMSTPSARHPGVGALHKQTLLKVALSVERIVHHGKPQYRS
eukprot:6210416-Amphidinium_carterae.2